MSITVVTEATRTDATATETRPSTTGNTDDSPLSPSAMESQTVLPPWKKYSSYNRIQVDPAQKDKSMQIKFCSFARPHMRALHCSWIAFLVAFSCWFVIPPLRLEMGNAFELTDEKMWDATIASYGMATFVRLIVGPFCDSYGPRTLFLILLVASAIPTACVGLVNRATDVIWVSFFLGIAGGTFVVSQYWTSICFTKEVVGTANALIGGWGNLGAGVAQLVIRHILLPIFEKVNDSSWRLVPLVPAAAAILTGALVFRNSDDSPYGNFSELKQHGVMQRGRESGESHWSHLRSLGKGIRNWNTWLLSFQYASCFGVELTMNFAAALYFEFAFGESEESSLRISAIFNWLNVFARGIGGFLSDLVNVRYGMRGRLLLQAGVLFLEATMIFVFASSDRLGASMLSLVYFSVLVQAAEGTTFALVPYVDPRHTGAVSGVVGAGGTAGAMLFGASFRSLKYAQAFSIMGSIVCLSGLMTLFIVIDGYQGILFGKDQPVDKETGFVQVNRSDDNDESRDSSATPNRQRPTS